MLVLGGIILMYVSSVLQAVFASSLGLFSTYVGYGLGGVALAAVLRQWAHTKESARKRIENFEVRECTCFCATDRPVVYQHIGLLMQATGEVCAEASEDEVLDAF